MENPGGNGYVNNQKAEMGRNGFIVADNKAIRILELRWDKNEQFWQEPWVEIIIFIICLYAYKEGEIWFPIMFTRTTGIILWFILWAYSVYCLINMSFEMVADLVDTITAPGTPYYSMMNNNPIFQMFAQIFNGTFH